MIYLLSNRGEENVAMRFSEFESLENIMNMRGKVKWVWVDCFTKLPLNKSNSEQLKKAGFKLCLVSPELQGRSTDEIKTYKEIIEPIGIDAVCTKRTDLWLKV